MSLMPRYIAHRGAEAFAPENTLVALQEAARRGYTWVEFDVQLTADYVPVLFHDESLERTSNGTGLLSQTRFQDLLHLDAGGWFAPKYQGEPVPSLQQALALCRRLGLGINIEIKPGLGDPLITTALTIEALQTEARHGALPPVVLSSFELPSLYHAQKIAPEIPRGLLWDVLTGPWRRHAKALDVMSIHTNQATLTANQACLVRSCGYWLMVYTVKNQYQKQRMLRLGVDSLCGRLNA